MSTEEYIRREILFMQRDCKRLHLTHTEWVEKNADKYRKKYAKMIQRRKR